MKRRQNTSSSTVLPPRLQPQCWGGGLRARLPPSRGCGAASPPDEERGSPFPLFSAPRPPRAPLYSLGKGSGWGVSSPGVKTPAPELGVSAQVSASVVTSSPGLGLDKSLTSKACTALGPGLPPAGVTTVLSVAHWVSALTLEYLFLALWDSLSPGSRLSAQPAPGVDFLLMSLLPQGLLGGTVELLWVSGTWSSLGGPSQVPALPAASAISWWRAAPVPLFLSRPCLSARG